MSVLYRFDSEEKATEYIGIVAEYIDIKISKRVPQPIPMESVYWMKNNLTDLIACFYEEAHDKTYFVMLFQSSEDATAFKLRFL